MKCKYRITKAAFGGWVVLLPLLALAIPNYAAAETCVVDRLTDAGEGQGLRGDLRFCINQAMDGDVITFEVTGTINLTGALPNLTRSISIEGPGASLLTVRQATDYGISSIFAVRNATVSVSGLTVANADNFGIANAGTLMISNSTVSGNGHGSYGGGIWNDIGRTMSITNSVVSGNGDGGGIDNRGTMTVSNSTIAGNSGYDYQGDSGYGGGIRNGGTLTISNSTISDNSAYGGAIGAFGGGILNWGTLTIGNSTISGNLAFGGAISNGGGIVNGGMLTISNSTISGNGAEYGGGIFNAGTMSARNTILANNTAPSGTPDLAGSLGSLGYNLIGNSSGGSGFDETDLLNVDPLLGSLQDNGGPTFTHALLGGSPAIDAGDNSDAPEWDQRGEGFPRIVNGIIDIGAYEVQE